MGHVYFIHQDKLFHFTEYLIIAVTGFFAFRNIRNFRTGLLIFGILFAASDEALQLIIPGREADILDFLADIVPFISLYLIKAPLKMKSASIEGVYENKVYDMLRSVVHGMEFFLRGSGDLEIKMLHGKIEYIYRKHKILMREMPGDVRDRMLWYKNSVYRDMEFLLDRKISPWGLLFQTRPTKLIERLPSTGDVEEVLKRDYMVSREKIQLMTEVHGREKSIEDRLDSGEGIYIGVPFCPSKCSYCSFTSYSRQVYGRFYQPYVESVISEMEHRLVDVVNPVMVYVGGGTPFALDDRELERILDVLIRKIDISALSEFTVEAGRPDAFRKSKCRILMDHGVTRIAVNPQTMNDETLKRVGRNATTGDFYKAYEMCLETGFKNINADLIMGLPGEGKGEIRHSVKAVSALEKIDNITIHTLSPKKGASEKIYKAESPKTLDSAVKEGGLILRRAGFHPYYLYKQRHILNNLENVGWAREGSECLYNVAMISEKSNIHGFGPGASSKEVHGENIKTTRNPKDLALYIKSAGEQYG